MAIDQPDKIDAIGLDNLTSRVVLTIADHLPWLGDAEAHRNHLRDKLNTYLAFTESGELAEAYPDSKGRSVTISVIGKYDLSPVGKEFYENASQALAKSGIGLEFKKLGASE